MKVVIVYCATRGENELFLAKVRCSARVGVEGDAGARDIDECENTSPESEIAFLPVLHTVLFLTKAGKGFFTCESRRDDWAFRVVHNASKNKFSFLT